MTKEDLSITYENNVFYCTKNNTKWISVDGEKWYGDEKRITELEAQIEKMKCCYNCKFDNLEPPEVIGNGICEHCKNHSKWELQY